MFIRSTSWLRRIAVMVVAALGVGVFVGCSSLDAQQRRWIFQPSADTWWGGSQAAAGMEDVWIDFASKETGHGARLHGLWLQNPDSAAPVLLYLHGARWDVASSAMRIRRMQQLGFSVLAIDYRGFGKTSTELPSEAMAREDARAAWDWLAKQYPQTPRYIFGHSLGGAIAVDLASRVNDESGLIVEGSFTRIRDVLSTMRWGWLPSLPIFSPLLTQRFDAIDRIASVGSPVLIVHGSEDNLIPPSLGHALYEHAVSPKRWVLVEGGTHHNTNDLGQAAYREAVRDLFGIGALTSADNGGLGQNVGSASH